MTNEQTTGTTLPDDGDAGASSTTGTLNGDGRDAASGEPDYKTMYLEAKDKVEEVNRIKAELEDLRARSEQPPAATDDDAGGDPDPDDTELSPEEVARLRDFAARGDVVAKSQLITHARQQQLARDVRDSFHLRDIPDTAERRQVLAHYAKNRHRLGDIKAAEAEIRRGKLESENEKLRKDLEAATKRPPADVVRTHSREVSSTEAKTRKMTYADFDREQAELKASGKFHEAMKRQQELSSGAIEAE